MLSRTLTVALAAASSLVLPVMAGDTTNTIFMSTPTAQPTGLRAIKFAGCFATAVPMINHGPHIYQTPGNCQQICYLFKNNAMALGNGTDCWCGDYLPPKDSKVDDSKCSTGCGGYPQDKCGSGSEWSVYSTGFSLNAVENFDPVSASSSAAASVTARPTNSTTPSSSAKPAGKSNNTVGIVVGVIVGIVLCGAIIGAGIFWLRRKQRKDMEEYQRQNDAQTFIDGGKKEETRPSMWAPDQRIAGNRMSNGSIADNQDYSRKILQVRNPDGF